MTASPAPRLTWGARPAHLACSHAGCGRTPLMGFTSADRQTFVCGACFDDGLDQGKHRHAPRFRTPEERKAILRCK
jgi:hypothetical protein